MPRWWRVRILDLRGVLLDLLPPDQRDVVLAHERSHRVRRHHVLQFVSRLELREAERRGELVEIDIGPALLSEE